LGKAYPLMVGALFMGENAIKPLERRQTKSNNRTIIFYYFHSLYVLLSSKNIAGIRVSSNVRSTERKRVVWDWIMDRALAFNITKEI
jgi:hypothetical protein